MVESRNSHTNGCFLTLKILMEHCAQKNGYKSLERLISPIGQIKEKNQSPKDCSWLSFRIESSRKDPASILSGILRLYEPERANILYSCNEPDNLHIPQNYIPYSDYMCQFLKPNSGTYEINLFKRSRG